MWGAGPFASRTHLPMGRLPPGGQVLALALSRWERTPAGPGRRDTHEGSEGASASGPGPWRPQLVSARSEWGKAGRREPGRVRPGTLGLRGHSPKPKMPPRVTAPCTGEAGRGCLPERRAAVPPLTDLCSHETGHWRPTPGRGGSSGPPHTGGCGGTGEAGGRVHTSTLPPASVPSAKPRGGEPARVPGAHVRRVL